MTNPLVEHRPSNNIKSMAFAMRFAGTVWPEFNKSLICSVKKQSGYSSKTFTSMSSYEYLGRAISSESRFPTGILSFDFLLNNL